MACGCANCSASQTKCVWMPNNLGSVGLLEESGNLNSRFSCSHRPITGGLNEYPHYMNCQSAALFSVRGSETIDLSDRAHRSAVRSAECLGAGRASSRRLDSLRILKCKLQKTDNLFCHLNNTLCCGVTSTRKTIFYLSQLSF